MSHFRRKEVKRTAMQSRYKINYCTLKQYDNKLKLVVMNALSYKHEKAYSEKGTINDRKLDENISRARSKIFEYAYCNPWEYFVTLTLDKTKYDRYDLELFQKDFGKFIRNLNTHQHLSIKYLLIPETHVDGAWHMHGFILGLPKQMLRLFTLKEHLPKYIREKLKNNQEVYDWDKYRKKFGFCDFEPIRNHEACAKYLDKNISKSLAADITTLGAHLYYCSKGLKSAEIKAKGQFSGQLNHPNFVNEYCSVKWYSSEDLR
jgi:hypothetical protein